MRDHQPVVLEEFNGLWKRGDEDSVPIDHFSECNNIQFFESGFETRDGLTTLLAQGNVLRIYNYVRQEGESLLILDSNGDIYHALLDVAETVYGPVLSIPTMTDFGFTAYNGRAYITPYKTETKSNTGENYQRGLQNEFVYVYKGDGSAARKAAGNPPTNGDNKAIVAFNSSIDGKIDKGIHAFAVTFSDGAGDSIALGPAVKPTIYAAGGQEAILNNIPIGGVGITQRKIWSTKAIDPEDWDATIPDTFYLVKTIPDNTTTDTIMNFSDVDLTVVFAPGALATPVDAGLTLDNTNTDGHCDLGLHVVGVVYETDTGYLTAPGPEVFAIQNFVNENRAVTIDNIPISPDSFVVKRHLVASRGIAEYNGDDRSNQLFFIPGGTIDDNVTTSLTVSFYDLDLLEDASHLLDNFSEIPAGVTLAVYNGRMVLTTVYTDISLAYLSAPGEPEAIDQVDGQIIIPLDGNPITNAQEFRDVLYIFKKTRTYAAVDNGDVPSTWIPTPIDLGIGASVHGVATVLDSGGVNIDYLLIVDWSGLMIFNGAYARPELTWKIKDVWFALERNDFANIQIMNDSLAQRLYITLPDRQMLYGDYDNGMNPKDIRWTPWLFDIETTTITLIDTNTLVIGSERLM
jgi:hypothetical protein